MDMLHIGLVSSAEETADRFFGELLGLPKTRKSQLPREVTDGLFGVGQDCDLVYYGDGSLVFEVFLTGWSEPKERRISHTCIEVADRPAFLAHCREIYLPLLMSSSPFEFQGCNPENCRGMGCIPR